MVCLVGCLQPRQTHRSKYLMRVFWPCVITDAAAWSFYTISTDLENSSWHWKVITAAHMSLALAQPVLSISMISCCFGPADASSRLQQSVASSAASTFYHPMRIIGQWQPPLKAAWAPRSLAAALLCSDPVRRQCQLGRDCLGGCVPPSDVFVATRVTLYSVFRYVR